MTSRKNRPKLIESVDGSASRYRRAVLCQSEFPWSIYLAHENHSSCRDVRHRFHDFGMHRLRAAHRSQSRCGSRNDVSPAPRVITGLPAGYRTRVYRAVDYYYYDNVYYRRHPAGGYEVIARLGELGKAGFGVAAGTSSA